MNRKGMDRLSIIRQLREEVGIPARYVSAAYDTIKALPSHVTFGGLELRRLRETGKITREEYHRRRNRLLVCRGEASQKGNLCLRIEESGKLRVTVAEKQWVSLPLFTPEKYRPRLTEAPYYTVALKRRDDCSGYDVRITIPIEEPATVNEPKRVMALDINSGHVDFAVIEKENLKPVAFGKLNCSTILDARKAEKRRRIHLLVNKVRNVAKHYGAEVVAGKLKTLHSRVRSRANRKTQGMNQYTMQQIMAYKLPMNGVRYGVRSEAYTSKVGRKLSKPLGLDVHKAAAYAFSVKVTDYPSFLFLRGVHANEEDGILSMRLNGGSEPTVLHQTLAGLVHNEAGLLPVEATPQHKVGAEDITMSLPTHILQVKV
jgi:IS605 OrfB family transposase